MFSRNMCLKHVQGALRNSITAFIKVSPLLKDAIWNYLEQYDLPVVTATLGHHTATQVPLMFTISLIS
jgi:nuclear pore complex protein Nup205